MAKRILSTVLLLVYILSFSIVPVRATEAGYQTAEIIVDSFGNQHTEKVLINEDHILFAPISWFTKYGLMAHTEESNRYVFYHAGEETVKPFTKRIYIDMNGREVSCGCYVTETKFQTYMTHKFTQSIISENTLYLPVAEMLPLFNAKIEITDDGILHINANAVSVFSALYGLNLQELAFDADRDVVGHEFMTASGMLIDTILGLRIDRLDGLFNTGEYNDYRELFKAYLVDDAVFLSAYDEDQTPTEQFMKTKRNNLKEIDGLLSDAKIGPDFLGYILDSELYPGFHDFKDFYSGMSDTAEGIYKIADYSNTYMNQVDDHLNMLEAVYSNEFFGEANPAYKAAVQITSTYGSDSAKQRKEIVHSALYDFIVSEFGGTAVKEFGLTPYKIAFKAVKLALPEAVEEVGKAAQLGYMDDVVNHACRVFDKRTQNMQFDTESLDELRLTVMLALVASRHAYNTFWEDHEKIEKISDVLMGLYLAAESVDCESVDYYYAMLSELNRRVSMLDVKVTGIIDAPDTKDIFDETYWHMSFGQSLGYNYVSKFSADGTFVARGMGSGAYENGSYTYSNGKLVIVFDIDGFGYPSTIEYSGNKDGFTSLDKYPMQVGEDYYTISPDNGGSQFFNESVETDPPIQTEDQSYLGTWLFDYWLPVGEGRIVITNDSISIYTPEGESGGPYSYNVSHDGTYTNLSFITESEEHGVIVYINHDMIGLYIEEYIDDDSGTKPSFGMTGDGDVLYRQGAGKTNVDLPDSYYAMFATGDAYEYLYFPTARVLYVWNAGIGFFPMYVNYDGSLEYMEAISLLNAENLPAGAIYTESNFVITDNK